MHATETANGITRVEVVVQVSFRSKKLENCFRESNKAFQAFGKEVGTKYIERVNILMSAPNLETLIKAPGLRCHPLKGNRKEQWAINLTGRWRLIFMFLNDQMTVVRIEEVSNHYDD